MKRSLFLIKLIFFISPLLYSYISVSQSGFSKRNQEPVIVLGTKLKPLLGSRIDRLSLMVWKNDQFYPIPFQIDERNLKGEYIFTQLIKKDKFIPYKDKDENPFLDENDEMIFMSFDAGEQAPKGAFPEFAEKGIELEIIDPLTQESAWVYLFSFAKKPPISQVDYVKLIPDHQKHIQRIEAKNYIIQAPPNCIYYDYLSLVHSDGTRSPDLVDRLKIRCCAFVFFKKIKIPFAMDALIKIQPLAYKDGKIRVLALGQGYMEGPAGIKLKGEKSVVKYYPTMLVFPIHLQVPLDADVLLSDFTLYGVNDFNENAFGMHYYDAHNPYHPEIFLDGKMSEAEKNMVYNQDHDWCVVTGSQGTVVFRILFPPEWDFVKKELYYKDALNFYDPPEDNPGTIAVGFDMKKFVNLQKGSYLYFFHFYFPQDFKIGDEKAILSIKDNPLKVKTNIMTKLPAK